MNRGLARLGVGLVALAALGGGCVSQGTDTPQGEPMASPAAKRQAMADAAGGSMPAGSGDSAGTPAGAGTGTPVQVARQASFTQCPVDVGAARLMLFDAAAWPAHLAGGGEDAKVLADWSPDFSRQIVVLVALGRKPTLGYSVSVDQASRDDAGHLTLPVALRAPEPGGIAATALSSPCVYALLEATQLRRLDVSDAGTGEVLQRWTR